MTRKGIIQRAAYGLAAALLFTFAPSGFADAPLSFDVLDEAELAQLKAGDIITEVWHDKSRGDGAVDAFAAVEISASAQQVWSVMTSCIKTLEVVREMKSCRVLETSPDGSWDIREQRFRAPFPLKSFQTIFRTDFTPYKHIKISRISGDMKVQDGLWQITPLTKAGDENPRMRVTYRARVQPKAPLPRFLLRRIVRKDTPELMMALRDVTQAVRNEAQTGASVTIKGQTQLFP